MKLIIAIIYCAPINCGILLHSVNFNSFSKIHPFLVLLSQLLFPASSTVHRTLMLLAGSYQSWLTVWASG